jgi:hypothetical protein
MRRGQGENFCAMQQRICISQKFSHLPLSPLPFPTQLRNGIVFYSLFQLQAADFKTKNDSEG